MDMIATPTALSQATTSLDLFRWNVPEVSITGAENEPDTARVSTGTITPGGTGTTVPASVDLFELGSLREFRVWRPVKFTRNPDYPKVILDGCKFKQDSGGFALFQREPAKYLGHYRRDTINELEKKHGAKKPRKHKDRS